jgi:hypothetical protein
VLTARLTFASNAEHVRCNASYRDAERDDAMMLHWHGHGWLVPALGAGCNLLAEMIVDTTLGANYFHRHAWPSAVATTIAAVGIWYIADSFERSHRQTVAETGVETPPREHSFMWVNMRWWAPIALLFAFVLALGRF